MGMIFLDTSALVKIYLTERGSAWMRTQSHPDADALVVISQATLIEAVATICRKARDPNPTQRITLEKRDELIALFRERANAQYQLVKVDYWLYTRAGDLCRSYQLRAYDAIQLTCALAASEEFIERGEAPLIL